MDHKTATASFFTGMDWALLRKQKVNLIQLAHDSIAPAHLDGIISLIDCLQDAAVADGFVSELTVFGDDGKEE